jgi:hypothetical protein
MDNLDSTQLNLTPSALRPGESPPDVLADSRYTIPTAWQSPTIKQLNQQHPEYTDKIDDLIKMTLLYEGGHAIKQVPTQFLRRRPRELQDVYQARVDRFTYDNILGAVFGWYRSALFKTPPTIIGSTAKGKGLFSRVANSIAQLAARAAGVELSNKLEEFYIAFRDDCDKKGTSLVDFFRDFWTNLALTKNAYVLIDLPTTKDALPLNLRDQIEAGIVDPKGRPLPYLVSYSPLSVINWHDDPYGNMEWAVIKLTDERRVFSSNHQSVVDVWYYFDRFKYIKYEFIRPADIGLGKPDESAHATLVESGPHATAKQEICPLLRFSVDESLWIANRAYLPVVDHLNHENSFEWALEMGNVCMPVIYCDDDVDFQIAETGCIKLPEKARYGWTEPEGKTFAHSAERLVQLREDIYRLMYLVYQGRRSTSSADGASAAAKEQDMQPAQDIMNEYGETICRAMQKVMNLIARVRGDNTVFDVRGMKFGKTITLESIQKVASVLALGVPSDDFYREVFRQTVSEVLPDANPDVLDRIYQDINEAKGLASLFMMALAGGASPQADLGALQAGKKTADMFNQPYAVPLPKKPRNVGAPRTMEDVEQ